MALQAHVKTVHCKGEQRILPFLFFFFFFFPLFSQQAAIFPPLKGSQTAAADCVFKAVVDGRQIAMREMVHKCHSCAASSEASVALSCHRLRAEAFLSGPLANKRGSVYLQLVCIQPYQSLRLLFPFPIYFPITAYPALMS